LSPQQLASSVCFFLPISCLISRLPVTLQQIVGANLIVNPDAIAVAEIEFAGVAMQMALRGALMDSSCHA
jgi:hypothetical protein